MLDRIFFVIGEAFVALRRNLAMAFAGVSTGAVGLFLLGMLAFTYQMADRYTRTVPSMFDIRVFLREGVEKEEVDSTVKAIGGINGVSKVVFIPSSAAWARMQAEKPELTRGIDNPLPDQIQVVLADIHQGERIASQIQEMPAVDPAEGVHYLRQEQKIAIAALDAFRVLGPGLVLLLLVATGILIYNTIRLTVLARRVEIRIMQLVGAPHAVIRVPFIIEGVIQGLVAGLFAGGLLTGTYLVVRNQLSHENLQFAAFPTTPAILLMMTVGGGYGLVCSLIAVRAPLRSQ